MGPTRRNGSRAAKSRPEASRSTARARPRSPGRGERAFRPRHAQREERRQREQRDQPIGRRRDHECRAQADRIGQSPDQSVARTVAYARSRGRSRFAAIVPEGEYGQRAVAAFRTAVASSGGTLAGIETYARGNTSIVSSATRLAQRGGFDTVLIADGARLAGQAASVLRPRGAGATQILGTELWSGEPEVTRTAGLRGAWFSAVSDARFRRFSDSYRGRFGAAPYRVSTLGYDAVLLALRVARDWRPGRSFPNSRLRDSGGFLGLDGAFRFTRSGVVERAMEVREVRDGSVVVVDAAPAKFGD